MLEQCFIFATIGFAILQAALAIACFRSRKDTGRSLGSATTASAVVLLSYLGSVCVEDYAAFSALSSIYFVSIDIMLFAFLHYTVVTLGLYVPNHVRKRMRVKTSCPNACGMRKSNSGNDPEEVGCESSCRMLERTNNLTRVQSNIHHLLNLLTVLGVIDAILLLSNLVTDATISYAPDASHALAHWVYVPHLLYQFHLFYTYSLVILICLALVYCIVTTPAPYHGRYIPMLVMILGIVAINALFLFMKWIYLDLSVVFYAFAFSFVYVINFHYKERALQKRTQDVILNALGHPVVFFDNEQNYCAANDDASFLVEHAARFSQTGTVVTEDEPIQSPRSNEAPEFSLDDFVTANGLLSPLPPCKRTKNRSFTWVREKKHVIFASYRCDFRVLKDERERVIGYLLVFIDNSLEIDTLTGFPSKAVLFREAESIEHSLAFPASVAVFDLNRLMMLNNTCGREVGDKAVRLLADNMRLFCPEKSLFARLDDANLLVLCPGLNTTETRKICHEITTEMNGIDLGTGPLEVQSAIAAVNNEQAGLLSAVTTATRSLRAQKMLDQDSAHSSLLDSLAQTLRECDGTTESHVQRTRIMGAQLGERLGLSDFEQSSLALLCLLHDIGKLGIPLEVLNKPGKLSDEEWDLMKSHVDKGFRIAMASDELKDIAPFIRHHHECWDGNGYPDGLKAESIPLLSRIIAVVDTYDAMVNDRPYRTAIPKREACGELMRCAGTQFDPFLVSEFISMLEDTGELVNEPHIDPSTTSPIGIRPRGLETYDLQDQDREDLGVITYTEYVLDSHDSIVRIDDEFTKLTGYTKDDLVKDGYPLKQRDLLFPEDLEPYLAMVKIELERNQEAFIEHRIRRKDGSTRYVFCLGRQFYDPVNQEPRTTIIATDIANTKSLDVYLTRVRSSAQRSVDFWQRGARMDALTGVLNSESFKNEARTILSSKQNKLLFGIVDIDNFKTYNDTYGHPQGDELIKTMALMLEAALPATGFAGRLGGDEFVFAVPMPLDASSESATEIANNIWNIVSNGLSHSAHPVTLSMGVTLADAGTNFGVIYAKTDEKLYRAKDSGRNQLVIF